MSRLFLRTTSSGLAGRGWRNVSGQGRYNDLVWTELIDIADWDVWMARTIYAILHWDSNAALVFPLLSSICLYRIYPHRHGSRKFLQQHSANSSERAFILLMLSLTKYTPAPSLCQFHTP